METPYERGLCLRFLSNLMQVMTAGNRAAGAVVLFADDQFSDLDWKPPTEWKDKHRPSRETWAALAEAVAKAMAAEQPASREDDPLARNLAALAGYLSLSATEQDILEIVVRYHMGGAVEELCDGLLGQGLSATDALARLLNLGTMEARSLVRPDGTLFRSGLITTDAEDESRRGFYLRVPGRLLLAVNPPNDGLDDIRAAMVSAPLDGLLGWDDFAHLGEDRDFVERLLKAALRERSAGINILLYGPPGTGKTAFCATLAARVGATLHAVGELDDRGEEPTRASRLQQACLSQRLLAHADRSLVLFDEMEDLLARGSEAAGSKLFMNRLLETNPVPTLWTTNDVARPDPALLRRFSYAIKLPVPPPAIRARIWRRVADASGLALADQEAQALAREFEEPPGLASSAVRTAALCGGGTADARRAVAAIAKLRRGGVEPPPVALGAPFDPWLTRADTDLEVLVRRLSRADAPRRFSLCLSGPPGTGKSAFVRHLAERMGLEVVQKRYSDLISKWLGDSERAIADAFAEAREAGSFLVFDEADSLLRDRAGAHTPWEVSKVNEMLTWMEAHPLPFACTTNLPDSLDPASLRRFTFKLRFDYLSRAQVERAFAVCFGADAPAAALRLDRLTPGDFDLVRRRAGILGVNDPEELAAMLAAEQAAKPGAAKPIGFVRDAG